jgi:predicted nucleotidyltransferase component of viral defense system
VWFSMSKAETPLTLLHEDPTFFQAAVTFTAAETAFAGRLIEKDYFCSILLGNLTAASDSLIFRGGTCLAKVHAGFYRLSEDLDFVVSIPVDASRTERRTCAGPVRGAITALPSAVPTFRVVEPLTGANNSKQYTAVIAYTSLLSGQEENLKIEVGIREPILRPVLDADAQTILLDPTTGRPLLNPVATRCLSKEEAFAEKFRAALTRREVAIRDFYDVDYGYRKLGILPDDAELVKLVRQKLAVPSAGPVDISNSRLAALRDQIEPQLRPVLRERDFVEFELERAVQLVTSMADHVADQPGR